MNRAILDLVAVLLPPCDREVILGDLAESSASLVSSLFAIIGFALRRQMLCWLSWQPWLAAIGLAATTTWLLMSNSLDVALGAMQWYRAPASWHYASQHLTDFTFSLLRLSAAAWSAGFAAARISRRTVWGSMLVLVGPSIHCFRLFHVETRVGDHIIQLSPFVLFLYLPLMAFGIRAGLRRLRPRPWPALLLIIPYCVQLILMTKIQHGPTFILLTLILLWPCWYLVWLTLPSIRHNKEAYSL
ncbi:hypothetical protein ACFPT7_07570 [Acidicapsa dinghuensis]|uniref:Uncharacterized protein n=1 Tax=Acidicapsa dinghuensis TaxID=2218256 RepID=A0ABW1ECZ2_9BACT|nr:hypothetical protein [Acidicapsa dinghuensis]